MGWNLHQAVKKPTDDIFKQIIAVFDIPGLDVTAPCLGVRAPSQKNDRLCARLCVAVARTTDPRDRSLGGDCG